MITVNNFTNHILHALTFSLSEDENLIILGSNGAGKSTLAKLLCGLTPSKNVELFSKRIDTLSAKERSKLINYVPPKLEIFDEYISVREYLELSRLYTSYSVDEALKLLRIEHLQNKPCKNLSSGEEQLTMLCSALLHAAQLTIFDEPTANLDPQKTKQVFDFLQNEFVNNKIIITHDLNIAYKLGFKILYIQEGKIEFFGDNKDFFEEQNLNSIFGESLKKVDEYFMVNL
ncbi:ABC transporter ATP-binding protein [Sulfurimonas sp. C5]|uniref:ABC transporter ATP-binding protein n=1 Tax=Sulfurimonas sp. C5 TaxID=3036947 RepID=UPI002455A1B9|nr:ABC transporter ATP-binding protein [Sulfurimonas sp. C5]MDH4944794.1 ABC transporter ATP-binding protein [Sulfurimonas sp. C5]